MRCRWTKPIPTPPGPSAGVLAFYIDAHALAQKFTQGIRSGKTGYAWIMDSKGIFLSHPERDFIGKNAFTVRKERMPAISFDAINQIQREKMLAGKEGWGTYISGWHRGMAGRDSKAHCLCPGPGWKTRTWSRSSKPATSWSVAVVAPASEVEGVIHTLYTRQFYLQVIIGLVVLSGTIVMLNFRYEQQFSSSLEEEVNRQKEKLQKSEARYQGLVENAADLIYTVDADGRILSINRYARQLFLPRPCRRPVARILEVEVNPQDFIGRTLRIFLSRNRPTFTWNGSGKSRKPAGCRASATGSPSATRNSGFPPASWASKMNKATSSPTRSSPGTSRPQGH